jgi:predicted ribosome quality control (RQC) complex YloA/Tae2 family protein
VQAFRSSDGLFMLRGRDARGNLAALKLARPDDLWLHAEGVAGAHVILRCPPGRIPERSLREAGALAALKSPFREAGAAKVQCARARHVHPVRGAKPGTVRVDRGEPGLTVRVDPELEALLAV